MGSLIQPEERVLATLNADGSRRWITPRLAKGALWWRRRIVGYLLIAVFVTLPFIRINGKPPLLLNIAEREFTFWGTTFYPTDTLLLGLLLMTIFVSIFLLTALFGRVWCGWACPQTVYMEFLFRPLDRFFGTGGYTKSPLSALPMNVRKVLRFVVFLVLSFLLANVFLSYFVGTDKLSQWVLGSPLAHPAGFAIVVLVTIAMLFDFGFFREQLCLVACPYGRMQSVMLDGGSLIVGYDVPRGEPRGKKRRSKARRTPAPATDGPKGDVSLRVLPDAPPASASTDDAEQELGDCIDCTMCVQVCPTGIDIRNGLQLECIHCAQCIDACNEVMTKIGRPKGLIRYSSESTLEGKPKPKFRARVFVYPLILMVLLTTLAIVSSGKGTFSVEVLRVQGLPYNTLPTGEIAGQIRVRITNRTNEARTYTVTADAVELRSDPFTVEPSETTSQRMLALASADLFDAEGRAAIELTVTDDQGASRVITHRLLGPRSAP